MGELKTRLRQAWQKVPSATLKELPHSLPRCLKNVIKKGDIQATEIVHGKTCKHGLLTCKAL